MRGKWEEEEKSLPPLCSPVPPICAPASPWQGRGGKGQEVLCTHLILHCNTISFTALHILQERELVLCGQSQLCRVGSAWQPTANVVSQGKPHLNLNQSKLGPQTWGKEHLFQFLWTLVEMYVAPMTFCCFCWFRRVFFWSLFHWNLSKLAGLL